MADSLREEVAKQYNNSMSMEDYFSQLSSPLDHLLAEGEQRGNRSAAVPTTGGGGKERGREEEGKGVEISSGVAWTLVAPLILLAILVLLGVAAACLWRLKDRRCRRGSDSSDDPRHGREEAGGGGEGLGDIEMHELHYYGGEVLRQGHPEGPSADLGGAGVGFGADAHEHDSTSRFRRSREVELYSAIHQRHPGDGGIPDNKGIQLLSQNDPKQEMVLSSGPVAPLAKSVPGPGQQGSSRQDVRKSSETLAHPVGRVGEVAKDLYCAMCQHYMAQRLHSNHYYHRPVLPHPSNGGLQHAPVPQFHPGSSGGRLSQGYGMYDQLHCHLCLLSEGSGKNRPRLCHENSLHHPHLPHPHPHHYHPHRQEKDRHLLQVSQSLEEHLHLVPRYQPPHPATTYNPPHTTTTTTTDFQDSVHQRLLHELTGPDERDAPLRGRASCQGLENPFFSGDPDSEGDGGSSSAAVFPGESSSTGNSGGRRGEGQKDRGGREEGPRIINSTSLVGESDSSHCSRAAGGGGGRPPARRHSLAHWGRPAAAVEGPDVSSIKMMSCSSTAWRRATSRLLPSSTILLLSSSGTPTTNDSDDEDDDDDDDEEGGGGGEEEEEEEEETLSLPSSISRFHASRVQFPPLMPDAQYPLTSTQAAFSLSWPGQSSKGDGASNLFEGLDNFSDNTSMQPNVGSSQTSAGGRVSDLRGSHSQTLSTSDSDLWGADSRPLPSSSAELENREDLSNDAPRPQRNAELADGEMAYDEKDQMLGTARREKVSNERDRGHGDASGNGNAVRSVDQQSEEQLIAVSGSGSQSSNSGSRYRKSGSSSPHIPKSASELHRARMLRGRKRKEQTRQDHKHGFFLIPKQDAKNGADAHPPRAAVNVSSVGVNHPTAASHQYVTSPSSPQVHDRPPVYRKTRLGAPQESTGHPSNRHRPTAARDLRSSPRPEFMTSVDAQPDGTNPLSTPRSIIQPEPHPIKLYSCKQPESRVGQSHRPSLGQSHRPSLGQSHRPSLGQSHRPSLGQGSDTQRKEVYSASNEKVNDTNGRDGNLHSGQPRFNMTYPVPELTALKASLMYTSFPSINQAPVTPGGSNLRPMAGTVGSRSSKVSRMNLKRPKSQEGHAYVNMGGSFFDDHPQGGRSSNIPSLVDQSGQVEDSLFAGFQPKPDSRQKTSRSHAGQTAAPALSDRAKEQQALSGSKTDSQILAEVLSSFPQNSQSTNSSAEAGQGYKSGRQRLGSVYTDVTIPTAFADELFGIWSLTPELDDNISPSQPRTPLMTPLKEDAKRANRKFIWGHSGSPSDSTSTSSFAASWPLLDDSSVDNTTRRRNLSPHNRLGERFDDYVQMDKNSSDQPRSTSAHMSISDSPSTETLPPTPTVRDAPGTADVDNADDPGAMDDYRTLPLTNLNMSHLYVISGYPDKDSVNNNADLFDTGDQVENITPRSSQAQANVTSSNVNTDVQNRNSATAAFAIVLEEQKYWL